MFLAVGIGLCVVIYRDGEKKYGMRNPLIQARESAMRKVALAPVIEDAEAVITKKWAELCNTYRVGPGANKGVIQALDSNRADLVYAACAVWRDPLVIDEVAKRLPYVFKGWKSA